MALYDWETFLSNASIVLLLVRWVLSMLALNRGYLRSETKWYNAGIGCLAGAVNFKLLVFSVLPRLKTILCAFWTVGCNFEGQQLGLSEAWFAMYPAIVEFVLLYYSLLNIVAKILRRRMSDALFVLTIIVLSLTHYHRSALARRGWLSGVESRVSTLVFSDEVERLGLADFFTSDVAMRLNGNVRELFVGKVVLLGLNLVPLALARNLPVSRSKKQVDCGSSTVMRAMALRRENIGRLGSPQLMVSTLSSVWRRIQVGPTARDISNFDVDPERNARSPLPPSAIGAVPSHRTAAKAFVESYELIRLGYVVYGGEYLLRFDDWDIISSFALLRSFFHLWNHRVTVWTLKDEGGAPAGRAPTVNEQRPRTLSWLEPEMLRLDDPRLLQVPWWDISACDIE